MPVSTHPGTQPEDITGSGSDDYLYRSLIEHSLDVVSVLAADGTILYDNPSVERVLGYRQGELGGANAFELVHPDDLSGALELLSSTLTTAGSQASITLRFRHKDGSWRILESIGKSILGSHGAQQVILNSRDVTQAVESTNSLKRARDELTMRVHERTREVEEAHIEMLERLARAAECRDDDTGEHTRRVGHLAGSLAAALDLPHATVALIERTAPLHDIGKIGIADSILRKPGPLTPDEFEVMRGHTRLGAKILAGGRSEFMRTAELIALHHHERWDGTGYPDQLAGEEIPIFARIVAVVDVFDALNHDRSYRAAWPLRKILDVISSGRGSHFDPVVTDLFLNTAG